MISAMPDNEKKKLFGALAERKDEDLQIDNEDSYPHDGGEV